MSPEEISAIAGMVLTLGFSYIPGLNERFASLKPEAKRAVMLVLLLASAAGAMALACAGEVGEAFGVSLVCDQAGAYGLLRAFALAVIANQSVYAISPKMLRVRVGLIKENE